MIATPRFPLLRQLALAILFGATLGAVEPARIDAARALFHQRGKSAEAQQAFEAIAAEDPRNHAAQYHLGLLAYRRDDMDACVAYLERAIALAPNDGASHKALGDAYGRTAQKASIFRQLGWAKKCLAAYQRAVALAPDQAEFRQCLFEYYFQAPGFAGGGRDKAVAEAAAIKRLDPHAGRLAFARIAIDDRKYADAFAQFEEVLARSPDDYLALYEIGRIAALTGRELDRGIRSLRRCLELTPPAGPTTPSHANVQWRLGVLLEKQGNPPAARLAYETALRLDADFAPAREALQKLKS